MYDVAATAGVSTATVSRFLAGTGYVGQSSRTKIAKAISQLGYVQNRAAASLKSRRSGLIGFVVSDIQNPFVAELAASIGDQARSSGYGMVLADSRGDPERAVEAVELLRGHGVDGIIATPPESPELNDLLVSLRSKGLPVVGIGLHTDPPVIDVATVNTRIGTRQAIQHLLDLGHERIAMIGSRTMARGRRDTYRAVLRSAKIPVQRELQRYGPLHRNTGVTATAELLALAEPPTAIFAANDSVALGVLQEAARQRISVPRQLSVIGFDDGDLAKHASPPLTTVAQPKAELGRRAVELLVARTIAGSSDPVQIDLPCALVVRASTARPPKRNTPHRPGQESKEAPHDHTRRH